MSIFLDVPFSATSVLVSPSSALTTDVWLYAGVGVAVVGIAAAILRFTRRSPRRGRGL
ncbi:hypothetical protein [Klugiella xanthotipulae]|uniref:Uncharacterized protein n=1 Tax=Klugiella xanthotipulae TaxID=244735 RepID=A0A543HYQ0_9MICO|nr:hypothetical protein [Klugiella xanthotipulae]TQM63462.1 hypothetical protein FB466_1725 [Klugiella xanthotipulae]